jgi:hypothetical protein
MMKMMYGKSVSELVQDPGWQKIRVSLLGRWKGSPEWCINQLKGYLGSIDDAPDDRLIIILNYLTGTAFRTGMISSRDNPQIAELRTGVSNQLKGRKGNV